MITEKKEKYTLITTTETQFYEFYNVFLETEKKLEKENIIVLIANTLKATQKELLSFLKIAEQKKENGTSFVIIYKNINVDEFPETFNIVPTLQEAEDIIEMEAIERELGF